MELDTERSGWRKNIYIYICRTAIEREREKHTHKARKGEGKETREVYRFVYTLQYISLFRRIYQQRRRESERNPPRHNNSKIAFTHKNDKIEV